MFFVFFKLHRNQYTLLLIKCRHITCKSLVIENQIRNKFIDIYLDLCKREIKFNLMSITGYNDYPQKIKFRTKLFHKIHSFVKKYSNKAKNK